MTALRLAFVFLIGLCSGLANAAEAPTRVRIDTSLGVIVLDLDAEAAPKSVENFLAYARTGHYDGTIFHRVIPGFMIQGGGWDTQFRRRTERKPIRNEGSNGLKNLRGTIAMARTNYPHSATCEFFINHVDNPMLDAQGDNWGYAVFGRVVDGMAVVDKIAQTPTGAVGPFETDVPLTPVVINKVTIESAVAAPAAAPTSTVISH